MTETTKSVRKTVDYKAVRGRSRRRIRQYDWYWKLPVLIILAILHALLLLRMCAQPPALNLDNCLIEVDPSEVQVGDLVSVSGQGLTDGDRIQVRNGDNVLSDFNVQSDGDWEYTFSADEAGDYNFAYDVIDVNDDGQVLLDDDGNRIILGTCENTGAERNKDVLAVAAAPTAVPPTDVPATTVPDVVVPSLDRATLKWGALAAAGGTYFLADQVELNGTASTDGDVRIDLDGTEVDVITANAAGNWSYAPGDIATAGLAPGKYEYTATALDADGADVGEPAAWPFYVTQKPTVDSHVVNDDGTVLLAGSAIGASTGLVALDGVELGEVAINADGSWELPAADDALAPGTYIATIDQLAIVEGMDVVTSDEYEFTIEEGAVALTFDNAVAENPVQQDDDTVTADIVMSGVGEPGATVELFDPEGTSLGTTTVADDGSWTYTATGYNGAVGAVGLTANQTINGELIHTDVPNSVALEAVAPSVVMLTFDMATAENPVQQADDTVTADIVMSGLGEAGATVELFDPEGTSLGTTTVADDGTWTYTATGYNGAAGTVNLTANQTIEGELVHTDVPNNVELAIAPMFPLTVAIAGPGEVDDATPLGTLPTVHLILDASWSMTLPPDKNDEASRLTVDDPNSRIKIAQDALLTIINDYLPEGAPVGLRAFGNRATPLECQTELEAPVAPLDRAAFSDLINSTLPQYNANTAIAEALDGVPGDLEGIEGDVKVVLLTDGRETCDGNPSASIATLRDAGYDVVVDIVGFAIADTGLKAEFESWAETGGGSYYDAADADGLAIALGNAFGIPYEVLDGDTVIATGQIGAPLGVPAGEYNLNILTNPPVQIDGVTVGEDGAIVNVK